MTFDSDAALVALASVPAVLEMVLDTELAGAVAFVDPECVALLVVSAVMSPFPDVAAGDSEWLVGEAELDAAETLLLVTSPVEAT